MINNKEREKEARAKWQPLFVYNVCVSPICLLKREALELFLLVLTLKRRFNKMAARLPVIIPSLTMILKAEGSWSNKFGTAVAPKPTEIEQAMINKLA